MTDAGDVVELSEDERRIIDAIYERRLTSTHYEILGVARGAERKDIRDAYFALSKRFHPDVFFSRPLGQYRSRIDELFRVFTRAYDVLGNARQRTAYDAHIATLENPLRPPPPVTEVLDIIAAARNAAMPAASAAIKASPSNQSYPSVRSSPSMPSVANSPPPQRASSPQVPAVVNLPPPTRTMARPVLPAIGTAVMPSPHVPPAPPPRPVSKVTPTPMQPLDPDTLRRARESMARRLNSVVPHRPSNPPTRAPIPASAPSQSQIPRVVDRAQSATQLIANAEEAQKKGDLAGATEALRQALALNKGDEAVRLRFEAVSKLLLAQQVDAHIAAARDAMREKLPVEAARHWEKAAEGRPGDPLLLLNAAEVLLKFTKDFKRATDLAQRVTMTDPNNVKAHVLLAGIFIKAGLKASAYASIQTIARISPDQPALKELREKLGPYTLAEKVGLRGR